MSNKPVLAAVAIPSVLLLAVLGGLLGCGSPLAVHTSPPVPATTGLPQDSTTISIQTASTLTPSVSQVVPSEAAQADIPGLVSGNTAFALDLFRTTRAQAGNAGANLVFSPYGLSLALAMAYAGSAGETESQMAGVLHFLLPRERLHPAFSALSSAVTSSRGATVGVAGSLWPFALVNDRLIPDYLDLVSRYYGASVIAPPGDVEHARQAINAWVSKATQGRATEVLPPGSLPQGLTAMVLVDAVSFSGVWTFAFPASLTREGLFHLADGTTVSVPLMTHAMDFGYAECEEWQAAELPYGPKGSLKWGDYSMVCLLPRDKSLDEALQGLTVERLEALLGGLTAESEVTVTMPRFKFSSRFALRQAFQALGMIDAFGAGKADFSAMYTGGAPSGIWVDDVYQTATVSVDENGTEAAAGSAVVQVAGIASQKIVLDRPFLFLIRHGPTGAILFMGQVLDPSQG